MYNTMKQITKVVDQIVFFGLYWTTIILVMEMIQHTAGAPRCREGYYWLSLASECNDCSNICFYGSKYIQSCLDFCGQTIPPTTTPTPPPVTNQTSPALSSITPPLAGVVKQVLVYIIPIIASIVIVIVALIFRHKIKALVTRVYRSMCPIHAALPTQVQDPGTEVFQTDLAHHPNGIALENANGIPVSCNNGVVRQDGSVFQNRVHEQYGIHHQNGAIPHNSVALQNGVAVPNGLHHQNGIIQQGRVNPLPNGTIHQNTVANQYEFRVMSSNGANVLNVDTQERKYLLSEELTLTNHQQSRQVPSATTGNANDVSQSLLEAESNDHTTYSESESNNSESPIGSTQRLERNVV